MGKKNNSQKAAALLIVVTMMMIICVMGVTLTRNSIIERGSSQNTNFMVQARLNALAGMERTVAEMFADFKPVYGTNPSKLHYGRWISRVNTSNTADVAAGRNIENAHTSVSAALRSIPSYSEPAGAAPENIGGYYYSGIVRDPNNPTGASLFQNFYTLKVMDTSSQINLNMPNTDFGSGGNRLENMLRVLFQLEFGPGPDAASPGDPDPDSWSSISNAIIGRRAFLGGRFSDKSQIVGPGMLTESQFEQVRDYLTVYGWSDPDTWKTVGGVIDRTQPNYLIHGQESTDEFAIEARPPINVNTAPRSVLIAALNRISGYIRLESSVNDPNYGEGWPRYRIIKNLVPSVNTDTTQYMEVIGKIADEIIDERSGDGAGTNGTFTDWTSFRDALERIFNDTSVLSYLSARGVNNTEADRIKHLIMANASPNALINRWGPNKERYFSIDKSDLTRGTVEFCFGPNGYFEIISIGRVMTPDNRLLATARVESVVQLANLCRHTTQRQFRNGGSYSPANGLTSFPETEYHCTHSFVMSQNGSPYDGYIQQANNRSYSAGRTFLALSPQTTNDFNSFWSGAMDVGSLAKYPFVTSDARSVFKGEQRVPEGAQCFNFGPYTDEPFPDGGRMLAYSTVPGTLEEGMVAMWIKFDSVTAGTNEALLYINQFVENKEVNNKGDVRPGHGLTLKVIRYGDTIHITRFVWEDYGSSPPTKIYNPLKLRSEGGVEPSYLWSRITIPLGSRMARHWYRLVVGWKDYTKPYACLSDGTGSGTSKSFNPYGDSLPNTLSNGDSGSVIRIEWASGSKKAANDANLGQTYMIVGGYAFKAERTGNIRGHSFSFTANNLYRRFANVIVSWVEGYSSCSLPSGAGNFYFRPYTYNPLSPPYFRNDNLELQCGCKAGSCGNPVFITGATYTFWGNTTGSDEISIDSSTGAQNGVWQPATPVSGTCGGTVSYRARFRSATGGSTSPVFDDITVCARLRKPRFLKISFPL